MQRAPAHHSVVADQRTSCQPTSISRTANALGKKITSARPVFSRKGLGAHVSDVTSICHYICVFA